MAMSLLSKYKELHKDPTGPGDQRPTALQIVQDEELEGKLRNKIIFITGFSNGLGIETARALAKTGAQLFLSVRSMSKGQAALDKLIEDDPTIEKDRLKLIHLELSSLESVRDAAETFSKQSSQLNVLINNAGIAMPPHVVTGDGFEQQFQINHLSHFLLFQLLKPTLLKSSTPSFQSRVVNISSLAHRISPALFGDYNQEKSGYDPMKGYGQSKTCNILMANEIERLYGNQGLHGLSVHPGGIRTGLMNQHAPEVRAMLEELIKTPEITRIMKNAEQGSATTVLAAIGKEFEGKGGVYLEDCGESTSVGSEPANHKPGYADFVYDKEGQERLWKDSLSFVGM